MKKLFSMAAIVSAAVFGFSDANAQAYKTGAGVLVDFGAVSYTHLRAHET